jgi:Fe-S-cluster containining protein
MNGEAFKEYYKLIDEIDLLYERLSDKYKDQMMCKVGCDKCCENYGLLPVEFYAIRAKMYGEVKRFEPVEDEIEEGRCPFLKESMCTIYNYRPIICRSHGLPLLFMGEDDNWEMSICDLNFVDYDLTKFTEGNTFPMDRYNSKLFMLNRKFLNQNPDLGCDEYQFVSLNRL